MKLALVYPPACDPTAPYIALPALAGFLRPRGIEVLTIDANVLAFDRLLSRTSLGQARDRIEARLQELDGKRTLAHTDAVAYATLQRSRGDAHAVPGRIDDAKNVLREEARFFDPEAYSLAVSVIDAALRVVSAAHHPCFVDFMTYRTPLGLTSQAALEASASPTQSPFDAYLRDDLLPRLRAERPSVVGLSVCFPGQLHPAYLFALRIKRELPDVHLTLGGPGITQVLARLKGPRLADALFPFDSAVLFEGEHTLLALLQALENGTPLGEIPNVVTRREDGTAGYKPRGTTENLSELPSPDFDGMPLEAYFAPRIVLPYDPTRGCYWGRCTFCHYGLSEKGTAKYREREVATVVNHLRSLREKYNQSLFYLSHDSVAPKTMVAIAASIAEQNLPLRWATDLKPEKYLTPERAQTLRNGGALACALGVESASNRVLKLIDKGATAETLSGVIEALSGAGIAVEAMCFTDFPTESYTEAQHTLQFLREHAQRIAVFIVGEFGLTHGSLVAAEPARFGIQELWELQGDRLGLSLMYAPSRPWKTDPQRANLDNTVGELSSRWALRPYPWAGAVSTAHTLLHYERFGPGVFRELALKGAGTQTLSSKPREAHLKFSYEQACEAEVRDGTLWQTLVFEKRIVSQEAYESLAATCPALLPAPELRSFQAGSDPAALPLRRGKPGRRQR